MGERGSDIAHLNVFPLDKPIQNVKPSDYYEWDGFENEQYERAICQRLQRFRSLKYEKKPMAIICFGLSVAEEFRSAFREAGDEAEQRWPDSKIYFYRKSKLIICPFFSPRHFKTEHRERVECLGRRSLARDKSLIFRSVLRRVKWLSAINATSESSDFGSVKLKTVPYDLRPVQTNWGEVGGDGSKCNDWYGQHCGQNGRMKRMF